MTKIDWLRIWVTFILMLLPIIWPSFWTWAVFILSFTNMVVGFTVVPKPINPYPNPTKKEK